MDIQRRTLRRYTLAILSALLAGVFHCAAYAGERHRSSFGFSIELPRHWQVITPGQVRDDPDIVERIANNVPSATDRMVAEIRRKIRSGELEYYVDPDAQGFASNINATMSDGAAPSNDAQAEKMCQRIEQAFEQRFDPARELQVCRRATIDGRNALYYESGIADAPVVSLQYTFPSAQGDMITLTGSFAKERIETKRAFYQEAVDSIRIE